MSIGKRGCPRGIEKSRSRRSSPGRFLAGAIVVAVVIPVFARAEYREVAVEDGGAITGTVSFRGALPGDAVESYPVSGKWPGCGIGYRQVARIDTADGALRGVFVLLDGITSGKQWPESRTAQLDQKRCEFVPTHQIVRSGASLTIRNSDTGVLHNVNVREIVEVSSGRKVQRMMFNIAQPVVGEVEQKIKPRKSPFLTVGCDLHNFMVAHILAPEHPYAALVNEDGSFRLDAVPPGEHSVVAWHPRLGTKRVSVTVPAGGSVAVDFAFRD